MKPRLDPVPFTREDTKIWLRINLPLGRPVQHPMPIIAAMESDRHDADLMLWAQNHPEYYATFPVCDDALWNHVRGWAQL